MSTRLPNRTGTRARIGVFGGTFDPPHVGHLVTAINVAHAVQLDRLLMMVNNVPWQKIDQRMVTPAADRLAMVTAAVASTPRLEVGTEEIEAGGMSYTADTLRTLRAKYPDGELFVVLGDDAAAGIDSWERSDEVIEHARLVVVDRPGDPVELDETIDWIRVEVPRLEVSSSDLRARFSDGRPLDYLVTADVLDVIRQRRLYEPSGDGAVGDGATDESAVGAGAATVLASEARSGSDGLGTAGMAGATDPTLTHDVAGSASARGGSW